MAASKGSKKAVKNVPADGKKKRRSRRKESFSIYVYKVLKKVHLDIGISSKAKLWNLFHCRWSFTFNSLQQLVCSWLLYHKTCQCRELISKCSTLRSRRSLIKASCQDVEREQSLNLSQKLRSSRASFQFPIGRIQCLLRIGNYSERVGVGSSVYLAAVLEYLSAEVLELAGNAACDNKKSRFIPRHL